MKRKNILITFILLIIVVLGGVYYLGARLAFVTGKTLYIIPPTPKKYVKDGLYLMENYGIYSDTDKWKKAKKEAEDKLKDVKSNKDANVILKEAIKIAGGKHSFLSEKKLINEEGNNDFKEPIVKREGNILFLNLPNYMGTVKEGQKYADILVDGIKENKDVKGVIVDLRDNDGGDMGPMIAGLAPILADGKLMSFKGIKFSSDVELIDSKINGGGTPTKATNSGFKLNLPVAVLVGEKTASSAEAVMISFMGLDNAKSFGKPTAGYASANTVIKLYGDSEMVITIAKDVDRLGNEYAEDPINPDVITENPIEDAVSWIKNY